MLRKKILFSVSLLFCTIIAVAQSKIITGKVSSTNGVPLAGTTVQLKNSKITTTTSNEGAYS